MSTNPIKTLANQLNALKSTGPRTPAGKAKASANSLKHGILSRNLLIPGEHAADFEALLARLLAEEQPVGTLEAALVERVAIGLWRQRRTVTAESASLHLQREALGAEEWQVIERLTGVRDRGLIQGTLRLGWSLEEAEGFATVFDTWLALPDADKPQDLAALGAAFPPLVELLHGVLLAAEAGLVARVDGGSGLEGAPGEADRGPVGAEVMASGALAAAVGEAGVEPGLTGGTITGEVAAAGGAAGAVSLGEVLAARCDGSLTELLYGVHAHFRQQLAILRAVSHVRAARLHLAAAEPMARYQAALDNELYKAIRALREAQAHRRANAVLEASPVAEVAG